MSKKLTVLNGKTIRDSVHGDIFFPEQFLAIIDTPEFQRLRRIHQLSVAYLIFPGAEHTRFSHSIGTYFIMQKIVEHFKPIMNNINLKLGERDINLALAVALLHDIGHGPFSHAFEKAIPDSEDHELWTIKIITNQDSNINRVLKESFDEKFPDDLADIIRKKESVKEEGFKHKDASKIDLFFILSSLISSQLDADRMDYLLRDSEYTGATFGNIDIERIISSMTLTVSENNYYVCFIDKFMTDIENYLLARYQMLIEIYLHPVKCEMEVIIKKILERAILKINDGDEYIKRTIPEPLLKLFQKTEISLKEYMELDDNILMSTISKWMKADDQILRKLCSCIIHREKYKKIKILNNSEDNINKFKIESIELLSAYGYDINNYDDEYFWIESNDKYKIYEENKDNIWILKNDGTIDDICKTSKIINERLNGKKKMTFINFDILEGIIGEEHGQSAVNDIKNLIKIYDNRNYIEIEKKYVFNNFEVFDKVEKLISTCEEYDVDSSNNIKVQEDYYYDTDDKHLLNEDKTLRFRKIDDSFQLTIKTPTKAKKLEENDTSTQNERFEYEISIDSENKNDNRGYIVKYLPEFNDQNRWNNLERSLTVINKRKKIQLSRNNILFEMVFDNVEYVNINGNKKSDYQIEIELKSEYIHRINLKMFSDYLEKNIPELKSMNESKYKRGINLTK